MLLRHYDVFDLMDKVIINQRFQYLVEYVNYANESIV